MAARDLAHDRAARRAFQTLAPAYRGAGRRRRGLRHDGRIDAGVALRPTVAGAIVLLLLLRALAFRGIDDRLLR
jgi:hypothetical protein